MRRVASELVAARADVARLTAAADPGKHFQPPVGTPGEMIALQKALLASQRDEQQAKLATLDAEYRKRQAELRAAEAEIRSEEHTSELQSLMRISYAGFRWKKKKTKHEPTVTTTQPKS